MSGLVEKIGLNNLVTWGLIIVAFGAGEVRRQEQFKAHINSEYKHLTVNQNAELSKITNKGYPFTAEHQKLLTSLAIRFEDAIASGRLQTPEQKRQIAKSVINGELSAFRKELAALRRELSKER